MTAPLLEVRDLKVYFPVFHGFVQRLIGGGDAKVHAVDGVTFSIPEGQVFGLVGESGCGKTTIAKTLVGLVRPTAGQIVFRGKDVTQRSFVGVAFHGVDATAYDAIYFRPFNFRATDPISRSHAVQYHSLPVYTWQKLRTDQPGKYEQAVNPVPDPNAWFRPRIVIANPKVSVFVGDAKDPCLMVNLLNDRKKGLVGLWVGNNSGGDFANLTIIPAV